MNKKIKLLSDSSCDILEIKEIEFSTAPLTINAGEQSFTDDCNLDINQMLTYLKNYNGKSSTACPSTGEWLNKFGDADEIFVVAMTSGLSGTYNSACAAKEIYLETHPNAKIYIFDTLSTGPEQALLVYKLVSLIKQNLTFEEIVNQANEYMKNTGLLFCLESLHNFAQNGRVSKVTATAVGVLGIRVVGKVSSTGTLEVISKCRGETKAKDTIIQQLQTLGYNGGKLFFSHVNNEGFAKKIIREIKAKYPKSEFSIYQARGLCSYYAENGGLLIGVEL